jgi:hypothetical protein
MGLSSAWLKQRESALESETSTFSTPILFRWGILDDLEIRYETGGFTREQFSQSGALDTTGSGMASSGVGFKWNFLEGEGNIPSMGLMASVDLPVGSKAFKPESATPSFYWLADFSLPNQFGLGVNLSVAIPEDDTLGERYAQGQGVISFGRSLGSKTSFYAEAVLEGPSGKAGPTQGILDGGLLFLVTPHLQVDFAVFRGLTDSSNDWEIAGGVGWRIF